MKIAIMQPTYFPWVGYFSLIKNVNKFVFLDNVQFARGSWQQRNLIANGDKKIWITVPVVKKNLFHQLISDVVIKDNKFKSEHLKSIYHSYSKTENFSKIFPLVSNLLNFKTNNLSDLNKKIIKEICNFLDIQTEFVNAKDLKSEGKKNILLSNICQELKADVYIAVYGSKNYMLEHKEFNEKKIKVEFYNFEQKTYKRGKNSFISNLSILDLLFYRGLNVSDLI